MCRFTPDAAEYLTRGACLPDARYALMTRSRKLIEVALPLDAINETSAREKSIRHGHPSTLHLWWARRPLAAARAVIFAQMVDDPSEYVAVRSWPEIIRLARETPDTGAGQSTLFADSDA